MGSVGNSNPWAPYNTYKDCSQGLCSIYCPQYCYLIFPPPPSADSRGGGGVHFSPLIIAVISVLASALLLVIYYSLVTRFCRRGRTRGSMGGVLADDDHLQNSAPQEPCHVVSMGLDEKTIKAIAVRRYRKGGGTMIVNEYGSECVVCLSEFQENEALRILPKCSHAFHLLCIDTWLASHSVCPLCRANVVVVVSTPTTPPPQVVDSQSSGSTSNAIIEVENQERRQHSEQVDASGNRAAQRNDDRGERETRRQFVRSNSSGAVSCSSRRKQWDTGKDPCPGSMNGSSRVKRSFSTGRLMFTDSYCGNKGKKSILPY